MDGGGGDGGGAGGEATSAPADTSSTGVEVPALETPTAEVGDAPAEPEAETVPPVVATPAETSSSREREKKNNKDNKSLLKKALEALQFRKQARLNKVEALAKQKGSISNDDVQKALRVSDATATRYLAELARQGRLKMVGHPKNARFEPS